MRRAKNERLAYHEFKTGLSFADVKAMLWSPSDDPTTWKYRRRHTVLGHWHQLKQQLYADYLDRIDDANRKKRRRAG